MKILFVVPRIKSMFGDDKGMTVHPHIGIAYLSSFLKQHKVEVAVFDEGIEKNNQRLRLLIQEFKPRLIGVTMFSYCYTYAYNLITVIKEMTDTPLVVGGPHICAIGKTIVRDVGTKFAITQEGEVALLELLKEMEKQHPDFASIEGLIWQENGEVKQNPERPFIKDLDSIPFPDYDIFDVQRYPCYKQKTLPIITSRGCPFDCNYCSVRLSMGRGFRARSAPNVVDEIAYFADRGWVTFDINDDCFTLDKKRAEEICDLIIRKGLNIRFQLYNGIRVDTVDPQLLKKMKQAGCFFISYGCEAGNDKMLQLIGKGITLGQVRNALTWTNKAGIHNSVNFIIGHTQETYQDAQDTLRFAQSLPTDFVNFYNLVPYPGTASYAWAQQHARFLVPAESFLGNISYRDNVPIFETDEFTALQRQEIVSRGFDLYRKKILTFRLGKIFGMVVYWITKCKGINEVITRFALCNPVGRALFIRFSRKSFMAKEEV
jgi:radical SAM superfamily enzyme YgiQ (UPF0313 family)